MAAKHLKSAQSNKESLRVCKMDSKQSFPHLKTSDSESGATSLSVGRSAAMMGVLVIISRITGFLRVWAQAYALGTSLLASCYTLANNMPNQLYELVLGGMIITAFLPVYVSVKEHKGADGANSYLSNLLSLVAILMTVLTVLCIVFAAQLVYIQSAGTDQSDMANAVWLLRFFAIEVLLYALSSLISGVINAERDYFWSNAAPIFNNIVTIASFVLFIVFKEINFPLALLLLALGNPLGVLVQVVLQIPSLRRHGIKISFHVDLHDPALKDTFAIGIPTLIVTACSFVTVAIMNTFALIAIPEQGGSVQYYARLWYTLPYSVFSIPITTAMFTELAQLYAKKDKKGFIQCFSKGASDIVFFLIPCAMFLIVFAEPLMLLLRMGAFSKESAQLTAQYLAVLSFGLPAYGLVTYFQKTFSSIRKMISYAFTHIVASVFQIVFTAVATEYLGIAAVALGSVLYYVVVDVISVHLLKSYIKSIRMRSVYLSGLWSLGLGAIGSACGYGVFTLLQMVSPLTGSLIQIFVYLIIVGFSSFATAFIPAILLNLPQMNYFTKLLKRNH